jgi:processive 1,2-diacylglycerol beta-glucosyltransferase
MLARATRAPGEGAGRPVREGLRLLTFTIGPDGGHNQAAWAVAEAIQAHNPASQVHVVDYLDLVSPVLSQASHYLYVQWVRHWPQGYGLVYRATRDVRERRLRGLDALGAQRVLRRVQAFAPDVVLATHPLAAGVLSQLKGSGRLAVPLAVTLTDRAIHGRWIHPYVDRYFVHDQELRADMARWGVPPERVVPSGIPVRLAFRHRPAKSAARRALGLSPQKPVVLLMVGAFGMLPEAPQAVQAVRAAAPHAQVVVVTGHDQRLWETLQREAEEPVRLRVYPYTRDIPTLMAAADLLVTKAGGMTMAEALAVGLPVVVFRPIPGQEEENARFLADRGAGAVAETAASLEDTVRHLLADTGERERMAACARSLGRPEAAEVVAASLAELARARPDVELTS